MILAKVKHGEVLSAINRTKGIIDAGENLEARDALQVYHKLEQKINSKAIDQ